MKKSLALAGVIALAVIVSGCTAEQRCKFYERVHADKFAQHMLDRDAHPRLRRIDPIESTASDVLAAFEASLEQERVVSEAIRGLYRIAQEQGDIDSLPLLHWFIEEQVEEESTVSEIIGRVKLIGDDGSGLLKLDQELGARPGGEAPADTAQ